jgi:hypothetical protein
VTADIRGQAYKGSLFRFDEEAFPALPVTMISPMLPRGQTSLDQPMEGIQRAVEVISIAFRLCQLFFESDRKLDDVGFT